MKKLDNSYHKCMFATEIFSLSFYKAGPPVEDIMRIRRAIIIPAILVLGMTGSVVAGSAMSAAPSTHAQVTAAALRTHVHS